MKNTNGCFKNKFLILGLLALILTVTYRTFFYARYMELYDKAIVDDVLFSFADCGVKDIVVVFDCDGEEKDIMVHTDANSWICGIDEFVGWVTFQKDSTVLHVRVIQNFSQERDCTISVWSGFVRGLGKKCELRVIQKGKEATYLNTDPSEVSFSEQGGTESVQINTDGSECVVDSCPYWITASILDNTLSLTAKKNDGQSSREDVVIIKSDEIKTVIKVLQNSLVQEKFTDFWKLFHGDSVFQKSRIKYPIPYVFYEYEYDGTDEVQKTIRYIKETEWNYDKIYDNVTNTEIVEKNDDSIIAIRRGDGCGILIEYYFEIFDGKWYLTRVEDYSD